MIAVLTLAVEIIGAARSVALFMRLVEWIDK